MEKSEKEILLSRFASWVNKTYYNVDIDMIAIDRYLSTLSDEEKSESWYIDKDVHADTMESRMREILEEAREDSDNVHDEREQAIKQLLDLFNNRVK